MRPPIRMQLRILATTDVHAHVLSWNYDTNEIAPARGLSRVATLIETARHEATNSLLFDNGDFLTGSALATAYSDGVPKDGPHPMVLAMNHLGYDAVAIGNHEFSLGLDYFRTSVAPANFPLICSNFCFSGLDMILPHAILHREMRDEQGMVHQIKVGVLALLPRETLVWEAMHLQGIATADPMLDAAQRLSQQLRDQGADIVIALAHTGFACDIAAQDEESVARALLKISTIDGVVAGHSHLVFPDQPPHIAKDIALVSAGFFGSHLGVIDLDLELRPTGWARVGRTSMVRPVSARDPRHNHLVPLVPQHPAIVDLCNGTHSKVVEAADRVVGQSDRRLHSYFSLLSDCNVLALIAQAQTEKVRLKLAGRIDPAMPVLAAVAPFHAGGRGGVENYTDLCPGPLRLRHMSDIYAHPNHLVAFQITGAELALWLERSASLFRQIQPGARDAELIDPDFPSFNFDVVFGVKYQINLAKPARFDFHGGQINPSTNRIEQLTYQGKAVTADQQFILASNNFRRDGTFAIAGARSERVVCDNDIQIRSLVQENLANPLPPLDPLRWRFCPMPGTTAIFESNPYAASLIHEVQHLQIVPLDQLPTGFQRFRLHL